MADFSFGHLIRVDDSVNNVHWSYGSKITITGATDLRGFERKVFLVTESVERKYEVDVDNRNPHTVFIKNLDDTNYFDVGLSTTNYDFRFGPGQHGTFGINALFEIFLRANTADCLADIYVHQGT